MAATHPEQLVPVWRNAIWLFSRSRAGRGYELGGGTVGGLAQGGVVFAPSALAPNWNRLDPASHVEQLFSLGALSRLLKSLLPTAVVVYFAVAVLVRDWMHFPALLHASRTSADGLYHGADVRSGVEGLAGAAGLVGRGLFPRAPAPRKRIEDEQAGAERRVQGDGRQSRRSSSASAACSARPAAAACSRTWSGRRW